MKIESIAKFTGIGFIAFAIGTMFAVGMTESRKHTKIESDSFKLALFAPVPKQVKQDQPEQPKQVEHSFELAPVYIEVELPKPSIKQANQVNQPKRVCTYHNETVSANYAPSKYSRTEVKNGKGATICVTE